MSVTFDWLFGGGNSPNAALGNVKPFGSFPDFAHGIVRIVEEIGADGRLINEYLLPSENAPTMAEACAMLPALWAEYQERVRKAKLEGPRAPQHFSEAARVWGR
jgi:hypothetical protein